MKARNVALGIGGAVGAVVAWKLLTRPGEVLWENVADKIHHAEHSHFTEVDGTTIHFQEFGTRGNPTLLLVHGYTASTFVWQSVAPVFADAGFHVVALDLVGFGFSDKPKSFDYTIASQARMIERFMDRLGIGRATIVGSSYGGAVSLTVALDYPERVEKLVLVDAVINNSPKKHPIMKLAKVPGVGEVITPFLLDSKAFMRIRMRETLHPANHHLITEERIEAIVRPLSAADGHHAVLASGRNWEADRIEEDLSLINQPTLIIWGENDNVIPIYNGEKLYNAILNSRFVVLKNCGHVPMEEKPEIFASLVTEFLKDKKGHIEAPQDDEVLLEGV
ncbi:MAG TPA: alpha/beta hydrolase [Pyrinomonadaceae bacterium]|nr:alpha/beta hydrolase [Pyrinomonadaceae bacterium]